MGNEKVVIFLRAQKFHKYLQIIFFFTQSHVRYPRRRAVDTYHWSLDRATQKHTGFQASFRFGFIDCILISRPLIYPRQ